MFALLGHKWHIWLAWTACLTAFHLISLSSLVLAKKDCSSSKDFNNVINNSPDEQLVAPECFSRRCQYHRQCNSDCPNTFCSDGGRCLCVSGFQVDLPSQSCIKQAPLWLMLTVMGAIFSVAYLITFCCLKHDLLLQLKQLRPERAVRFTAINQRQRSSATTAYQNQRLQSLDNESISSSSSSSLNDTPFTQCASSYLHHSSSTTKPKFSGSAASVVRKPITSQTYTIDPKGHPSTANYENITPQAVSSTEI